MGSVSQDIKIVSKKGEVLSASVIQELKAVVSGDVVIKGEASEEVYLAANDRFNKAFVSEADFVVFCKTEQDVAASLAYVQKYDLNMTVVCGRHSYYGASSIKGGLVIDLREMKKVTIDQEGMTITAQGGCKAMDCEEPLQKLGLSAVFGAANDTGIGGITLGGGSGFLSGQYGLVIDNLVAARVVLANGSVISTSEKENPDMFWGLRGGGSNFGVVSEFTYRVHEQGDVFFGPLVFTPDKIRTILELGPQLRELVESDAVAGKLSIFLVFLKPHGMPSITPLILAFYDGPADVANELLKPLLDLGPVANMMATMPYGNVNVVTPLTLGPLTHQHYATTYVPLFDFDNIDLLEGAVHSLGSFLEKHGDPVAPSKMAIEIRSHKKSCSVDPASTALRARVPALMMIAEVQHDGSVADANAVFRAELNGIMGTLKTEMVRKNPVKGRFFNANIGEGTEKLPDMYGENLARLRELKTKYDPGFVFDKWYPIPPAEA